MRAIAVLALLAFPAVAAAQQPKPEPKYRSKPLAYWVERLQKAEAFKDQSEAARAIQAFGPDAVSVVPLLVELLDDRAPEFRNLVAGTLCGLGPHAKSAVPELVKILKEKRARDPLAVLEIFSFIGPDAKEAVPLLTKALEDPVSRDIAMEALGKIGPAAKAAVPQLRFWLKDESAELRRDAAIALWRIERNAESIPVLVALLKEKSPEFSRPAATMLGEMGIDAKDALPDLKAALEHPDTTVQSAARWAIEKIEKANPPKN